MTDPVSLQDAHRRTTTGQLEGARNAHDSPTDDDHVLMPIHRGGDYTHFMTTRSRTLLAAALLLAVYGCGGSAIKKDTRRLERKCGVVPGQPLAETQARCIGRLYGLQETKRCVTEVDRPAGFHEPVYRLRESCSGIGVVIAESDGRVLALESE